MNTFARFFLMELRGLKRKKHLIVILILFTISLGLLQYHTSNFKKIIHQKEKFLEYELKKIDSYQNYTQYGGYGFRLLFINAASSIFFKDSVVLPEVQAFVHSGDRLKIFHPLKGKNIFSLKKYGLVDYSGIILFLFTLVAILYGFEPFLNDEYMKFMSTLSCPRRFYLLLILSRASVYILVFLVLNLFGLLLSWANGVSIPIGLICFYFLPLGGILLVMFLAIGVVAGAFRSKLVGLPSALAVWVLLIIVLPSIVLFIIKDKSNMITSLYEHEMEKLKIVMGFEKRAIEKNLTHKHGEEVTTGVKDIVNSYKNNELKIINEFEDMMRSEMTEQINSYFLISMLFPTTHYVSVTGELSSGGYLGFLEYYSYTQDLKRSFFDFYMHKRYYSSEGDKVEVENFVKGDENLFYARSRVPTTYWWGLLLTLFYTGLILWYGYRRFLRYLRHVERSPFKTELPGLLNLEIKSGKLKACKPLSKNVRDILYRFFSGSPIPAWLKLQQKILYDGEEITGISPKKHFVYVCRAEMLPSNIRVDDFIAVVSGLLGYSEEERSSIKLRYFNDPGDTKKRIHQLTAEQAQELMTVAMHSRWGDLYLIDELTEEMTIEYTGYIAEKMQALASQGAAVIYLSTLDTVRWAARETGTDKRHLLEAYLDWGEFVQLSCERLADDKKQSPGRSSL